MFNIDSFWIQLEKGQIVRRIAFFGMMILTWETYQWVMAYVDNIDVLQAEHSMLIAAVLTPISALQGAIIKFYSENPSKPEIMMNLEAEKKKVKEE